MRSDDLIKNGSPCDLDFTDKRIQTPRDFLSLSRYRCPCLDNCLASKSGGQLFCYRVLAVRMARYVLSSRETTEGAFEAEKRDLLAALVRKRIWVCREDVWQEVAGVEAAVDEIVEFAKTVLDMQLGERRPFSRDGMRAIEFGPEDAMHNAMLDLDDVHAEIGLPNQFR